MSRIFVEAFILFALLRAASLSPCENEVDITGGERLDNGNILYQGVTYERGDYISNNETNAVTACSKLVLNKCCPLGHANAGRNCINTTTSLEVPVWDDYSLLHGVHARDMFRFKVERINCTGNLVRVRISQLGDEDYNDNWHLKSDGNLFVELSSNVPPWMVLTPDKYCIDTFVYTDANRNTNTRLDVLACFADEVTPNQFEVRSACMLISCVFILATVAVYAWLPELRNMHGRVLMAYLLCLFVGFICMSSMQIMLTINNITSNICVVLTIIIYFALESAFFWLNVMSFDIWWTFSGKGGVALSKLSKRFFMYSLYAFGVPIILTIIVISLEFSGLPPSPFLPLIRYQGCFLFGRSKLLYFYGPMFILCLANMVFFIMTAVKITQIKQQTAMLKSKESAMHDQHRKDKQRLLLYLKLFTVMGINWILEVISALYPTADYFWTFTDVYNILIGVIIFVIFVCKKKIFHLIKKRYKQLRGEPMSRTQTISTRITENDDFRRSTIKNRNGI